MEQQREREILEVAMQAGQILLKNGAEIFRVEETIDHICRYFQVHSKRAFVLSNGIFLTAGSETEPYFAKVEHIPVGSANLAKIAAVNQLSREIVEGRYSLEEVRMHLDQIQGMRQTSPAKQILASGIGCASFCYLFGGRAAELVVAFFCGILLYSYILYISGPKLSKIVGTIAAGSLVTIVCGGFYLVGIGQRLDLMIIGSVMPLVPGVAIINGIRDIVDGDYISGFVRMLDALLTFFCIAIGVGIILTGGLLL